MGVKAIIFDWGDVLSRTLVFDVLKETSERFGIPEGEILRAYIATAPAYERGSISSSQFVEDFLSALGDWRNFDPDRVLELPLRSWTEPDPTMIAVVRQARQKYKTALLSNNIQDVVEEIRKKLPLDALFDVTVFSNEVGMRKPEPEIYTLCLDRLGVAPEEAVFIDNHESMCEGAQAVGLKALHFTGREKLLRDLSRLGVELPVTHSDC